VYRDEQYFYKVWRSDYLAHKTLRVGVLEGILDVRDEGGTEQLPGFALGLFDDSVCPAFADYIFCGEKLAGYRMRVGVPIEKFSPFSARHRSLVDRLIKNSLRSGIAYSDMKSNNIIRLPDGKLSLIDLDAKLVALHQFPLEYDAEHGSMAPFVIDRYKDFLRACGSPTSTNQAVERARSTFSKSLPAGVKFAVPPGGAPSKARPKPSAARSIPVKPDPPRGPKQPASKTLAGTVPLWKKVRYRIAKRIGLR
jgi:hypothetical protein